MNVESRLVCIRTYASLCVAAISIKPPQFFHAANLGGEKIIIYLKLKMCLDNMPKASMIFENYIDFLKKGAKT